MRKSKHGPEIIIIFLFGVMVMVAAARLSYGFTSAPAPTPSGKPLPSPTPEVSYVSFTPVVKYTTLAEREKIKKAEVLLNKLKNGDCVFNFLANRKMIQTGGRTPLQVAEHIRDMKGNVPVEMYFRADGLAIAYRQPPYPTIHLNQRAFTLNASVCTWANTMVHETSHSLGNYGHDFNWNAQRDYSVPYSLNAAFKECCNGQ